MRQLYSFETLFSTTFKRSSIVLGLSPLVILLLFSTLNQSYAQCVSLTTLGSAATQNFNTLSNTAGSTTNNLTITGWFMTETGGGARDNEQYAVDTGGSNTGDTYSYGSAGANDRALGSLRSGTLISSIGSCFTNNTGSTIESLTISYFGEEWRLGTAARTDQIDFQYSLNATSLTTGTWVDINALDFITPNTATTGAKDGNALENRTNLTNTISGLSIPNGATFWIRWNDADASGADDGLAVDDFSLTPNGAPSAPDYTISTTGGNIIVTDVAGNAETLTMSESGGNLRFVVTPTSRTYSINGGATTAFTTPADVAIAGASSISINTDAGNDIIDIGAFSAALPSLTINGGNNIDNVQFTGAITYSANSNLLVTNAEIVTVNGSQSLSGSGTISIISNNSISVNSSLTSPGNINLSTAGGQDITIQAGLNGIHSTNGVVTIQAGQDLLFGSGSNFGDTRGQSLVLSAGRDIIVNNITYVQSDGASGSTTVAGRNITITGNSLINCNGGNASNLITTGANGDLTIDAGSSINANGGAITLNADNVALAGSVGTSATVTIRPVTAGRSIDLGTNTVGSLSLISSEINQISAGTLIIGRNDISIGTVTVSGAIAPTNATALEIITARDIVVNDNLTGGSGGLILSANQQAAQTSDSFVGISVNGAVIEATDTGSVNLYGKGGDSSDSEQIGIQVINGGTIRTSTGMININGQGGGSGSSQRNYGFRLFNPGSSITTTGGSVEITGIGGNTDGHDNKGILIDVLTSINIGGTGSLELSGTGGNGAFQNAGIEILANSNLTLSDGNLIFNGTGGGNATANTNRGVFIGSLIDVGGSGIVSITGIGGIGSDGNNQGILFETSSLGENTSNGVLQSAAGEISIEGTEGDGDGSEGLKLNSDSKIESTGNGNINLVSNSMNLAGSSSIITNEDVTLLPRTAGFEINLGGSDAPGILGLTNSELNCISAGTIIIGDTFSGKMAVSNNITRLTNANVELYSAGDIEFLAELNTGGGQLLLTPGTSPSVVKPIFSVTDVIVNSVSIVGDTEIIINGNNPGNGTVSTYTQLKVSGIVNLTGVGLTLSGNHVPSPEESFIIVDNDGDEAIVGNFNSLAEGTSISNFFNSGLDAQISYIGGDGNDVVLTILSNCVPPTISCPEDQMLILGPSCSAILPDFTELVSTEEGCGMLNVTQSPEIGSSVSGIGSQVVILTVTDENSSANSCTFTVTKIDNTPPAITCPATQSLILGANCTASLPDYTGLASTGDNCGVTDVTQSPAAGTTVSGADNMTVTLTVTDVNGMSNSCSFTVIKMDNTPPAITCPATQSLILGANCTASLPDYTGLALTGDNCGVQEITQSPSAGTIVSSSGNMSVILTVTDVNGLTNTCSFTVSKVDNTPPSITCPASQELVLGNDCSASLPDYSSLVTPGDNCGIQGVVQTPIAGTTVSEAGDMTVILSVTDVNGMSNNCSFTVTIEDNTPPEVQCFNQTINFNGEMSFPLDSDDLVDTDDNCGVQTVSLSPSSVNSTQTGQTIPVLVTVTDINGNSSTCTSQVSVSGLPPGWSQNVDGVGCDNGNNISYNTSTEVWTATSTNCFYSSPFTSDQTAFAQRTLCGNGSVTAEVTGISGTSLGWAGIVMRESNAPGSKKVQVMSNLSNFFRREVRTVTNGPAAPQQFPSNNRNWLRLVRTGNQIVAFSSPNGISWSQILAVNVPMNACIEMGLVVTNYNQNSTVTATFDNVSYTGSGPSPFSAIPGNGVIASDEQHQPDFSVYPNPTSGELNIDLKEYFGKNVRIELYSLEGKLMQVIRVDEVLQNIETLHLDRFAAGMYFIKLKSVGLPDVTKRVVLTQE